MILKVPFRAMTVAICVITLSFAMFVHAQDGATATPAPSKTPEPTATESIEEADSVPSGQLPALPRAFTQEDLSVLVGNVQRPNGIVWFDDNLYTACNGDWTLYRIDSVTGATITYVFGVQNAHQIHAEQTDLGFDLWIPDADTNQLVIVDQRRSAPAVIANEGLDTPWGIVPFAEDSVLVSNLRANNVVMVNRAGEVRELITGLRAPAGLAREDDFVYVANVASARRGIEWFDINDLPEADSTDAILQPLVTGLQNVSGVVMADDGYLYFTYALGTRGVVGRVNPAVCRDGGCSNDDVEIVVFTELQAPLAGLTISSDMRLFVHTIFRPEIYWLQLPTTTSVADA